jgi:hypothetical protein
MIFVRGTFCGCVQRQAKISGSGATLRVNQLDAGRDVDAAYLFAH